MVIPTPEGLRVQQGARVLMRLAFRSQGLKMAVPTLPAVSSTFLAIRSGQNSHP